MCSTRSASVSTWPYIIVAVVDMPRRCAWRITSSHSPAVVFLGAVSGSGRYPYPNISPDVPCFRLRPSGGQSTQGLSWAMA